MSDYVYAQSVTAEDLNNTAVDLGVGEFSVFTDSTPYAVEQLNSITQALVGEGISTQLNKFSISINDGKVTIGTGIAFFASGRKYKLTTPVELTLIAGEVFISENVITGNMTLSIGELPSSNYIHLYTLNEDGSYQDKRAYAQAKVPYNAVPFSKNTYIEKNYSISTTSSYKNADTISEGIECCYVSVASSNSSVFSMVKLIDGSEVEFNVSGTSIYAKVLKNGSVYDIFFRTGGTGGSFINVNLILM